jgi:hypothetical protein
MKDKAGRLQAQLVIITGLLILSLIFKSAAISRAAAIFGIIFLMFPMVGNFFVRLWLWLGESLGWINNRILLSIIFFLFLFPISLLARLFNKDPLKLKKSKDSCYAVRNHKYVKGDLENIW